MRRIHRFEYRTLFTSLFCVFLWVMVLSTIPGNTEMVSATSPCDPRAFFPSGDLWGSPEIQDNYPQPGSAMASYKSGNVTIARYKTIAEAKKTVGKPEDYVGGGIALPFGDVGFYNKAFGNLRLIFYRGCYVVSANSLKDQPQTDDIIFKLAARIDADIAARPECSGENTSTFCKPNVYLPDKGEFGSPKTEENRTGTDSVAAQYGYCTICVSLYSSPDEVKKAFLGVGSYSAASLYGDLGKEDDFSPDAQYPLNGLFGRGPYLVWYESNPAWGADSVARTRKLVSKIDANIKSGSLCDIPAVSPAQAPLPSTTPVAIIKSISNKDPDLLDAQVIKYNGQELEAKPNMTLVDSDRIRTGYKTTMTIDFFEANANIATVEIEELTEFKIGIFLLGSINQMELWLKAGGLQARVSKLAPRSTEFSVKSVTVTASVRGTIFEASYDPAQKLSTISVTESSVLIVPANPLIEDLLLKAGQSAQFGTEFFRVSDNPDGESGSFQIPSFFKFPFPGLLVIWGVIAPIGGSITLIVLKFSKLGQKRKAG